MKKLMFAMTVMVGASAFALTHICEGFNLADSSKWPSDTQWGIASMTGNTQNYTMTADVTKNVTWWRCLDCGSDTGCTLNVDFGGHTFTYDNASSESIKIGCGPFNPDKCSCVTEFKNGVFSGGPTKPHLEVSWSSGPDWHGSPWGNSTVKFTDLVITNFNNVYFGRGYEDSQIILKNCSLTADNFRFQNENLRSNFTMTFENTELNWAVCEGWMDEGNIEENVLRKYTFTGSKTLARTLATGCRISFGYGIPYGEALFDKGATLLSAGPVDIGRNAVGKHWTVTFDNGAVLQTLSSEGIYNGLSGDYATLIVKNGAKVITAGESGITVGYNVRKSDNCTLIVSNADLSACGKIYVGGSCSDGEWMQKSVPIISRSDKAFFVGRDTKFKSWPLGSKTFFGADGLVVFDDVTLDFPTEACYFYPTNPFPSGEGGDEWYNNELRFVNGTDLDINLMYMGLHWEGGLTCDYQKLTFGNNVKADIGCLMVAGSHNTLMISNATVTVGKEASQGFLVGFTSQNAEQVAADNVVIFAGNHPKIRQSYENTSTYFWNNTTVRFILPEDGVYLETPVNTLHILCGFHGAGGSVSKELEEGKSEDYKTRFEFPNIKEVCESLTGSKQIELMRSADLNVSSWELENAFIDEEGTPLPDGCSLSRVVNEEDNTQSLILTLKGSASAKPGAVLIIK